MRYAGATGQLTVRADSGFLHPRHRRRLPQGEGSLLHHSPATQSLRNIIEATPEADWMPIPYWMEDARRCGEDNLYPLSE